MTIRNTSAYYQRLSELESNPDAPDLLRSWLDIELSQEREFFFQSIAGWITAPYYRDYFIQRKGDKVLKELVSTLLPKWKSAQQSHDPA